MACQGVLWGADPWGAGPQGVEPGRTPAGHTHTPAGEAGHSIQGEGLSGHPQRPQEGLSRHPQMPQEGRTGLVGGSWGSENEHRELRNQHNIPRPVLFYSRKVDSAKPLAERY